MSITHRVAVKLLFGLYNLGWMPLTHRENLADDIAKLLTEVLDQDELDRINQDSGNGFELLMEMRERIGKLEERERGLIKESYRLREEITRSQERFIREQNQKYRDNSFKMVRLYE